MDATELAFIDGHEIARLVRSKAISAVEVARAMLARIDRHGPALNCFITVCHESALADAAAVDDKIARDIDPGPLAGVPLHVKDLVNTRGVRTTFGSFIHEHNVPPADALSIARLRAAGAVLVGKTTTPEFGHMVWTEAPLFGRTPNAWDKTRTAGGSSGGAAVAAAAGLGQFGVATCGGGSTRIPAAANGVVGLKQSLGLIPHDMAQDSFGNMAYITPMTRSVIDTAMMLEVMAGPSIEDVHSFGCRPDRYVATVETADRLDDVRMAWRPYLGNTAIDSEVLRITSEAARTFEGFGARLREMADDMEPTEPLWLVLTTTIWNARFKHLLAEWSERMSPTLKSQMALSKGHTAEDLMRAQLERTRIFRKVQHWFDQVDILIMPTLTRTALPLKEALYEQIEIEGRPAGTVRKAWYPYTHPFNLTGHPAITLPAGFHSDGLPVAIQLVGRRGEDALLLKAARLFEQARPWAEVRPTGAD